MKALISSIIISASLSAPAFAVEPIEGSIGYNGASQATLKKTPPGSVLQHRFTSSGQEYLEIYVVDADGRPQLVSRNATNGS